MCPFCLSGAVLMVTSVLSAGGLTAFAAKKLSVQPEVKKSSLTNKPDGGSHASHSSSK
jgi:hypothetical protein